jgi:membrane carboxypeptidase/penicillin-binding protein
MPSASQTIKLRRLRQARVGRSPWLRLGLISALLISLVAVALSLKIIWNYVDLTHSLPSVEILPILLDPPNGLMIQPTRLFDRERKNVLLTLENPAAQGKQYLYVPADGQVGKSQVSKYLIEATIAELDPGFWNHAGFSLAGITEGTHPTLAQILVSNLLLDGEPPSIKRNVRERLLAAQVTAQFGRDQVLEWYLNSAQYGETIFGADAAARVYFGKSAADLSVAEAAMLTAMAEKPSVNPLTGDQILAKQKDNIIQKMFVSGLITADEALQALVAGVHFQSQVTTPTLAPEFTGLVLKQLSQKIPLERLYRGGFDIVTTLDYGLQQQADCVSQVQLARLKGTQETALTFDGSHCEASSLLPGLHDEVGTLPEDISVEVVVMEPHTGQILAMVGENGSGMLPSSPPEHSAGTILSPFMYLTAFSRGMSPATMLWDIPADDNTNASNPVISTKSSDSTSNYHGPVSLRQAFVNDYPGAVNDVLQQVGASNVILTENQFGLGTANLSSDGTTTFESLSSQTVSLLDGVQAYTVLADQGIMAGQPIIGDTNGTAQGELSSTSVLKVESVDGQVWLDWTVPEMLPVVTRQIAYLTTNVLSDEKARVSSLGHPNSTEIGRPAAAKVSMAGGNSGAWTVGYVPQLAVGVWMGDSEETMGGIKADMPSGLWHAIMEYATKQTPVQDFSAPTGVSLVQVCYPSGLLVSPLCPSIVQEAFLNGNEPTQVDNLYQKVAINRETGLLATVFTPPEMIEEKVFLAIPQPAQAWAREAGMDIPPDTFDTIVSPQLVSPDVQISDPRMFDQVAGMVTFTGSAGGEDFSYYRIQVGQGLNPQKWLQIGQDVKTPVTNGTLSTWDTSGLQGLYVVQLQVIRNDSHVDQAVLQLTIDNSPPELKILSPHTIEQIIYHPGMTVMMSVSATDNLVVKQVEFYVDDKLEATLLEPFYVILWDALPGEHTLRVKVYDLAGNQSEASIPFVVSK